MVGLACSDGLGGTGDEDVRDAAVQQEELHIPCLSPFTLMEN